MIDVDDLSDGLWIAAFDSELHVEDRALDTPKIKFSANKILMGWTGHTKTRQQWSLTCSSLRLAKQLEIMRRYCPNHRHRGSKFYISLLAFASLARETASRKLMSFLAC